MTPKEKLESYAKSPGNCIICGEFLLRPMMGQYVPNQPVTVNGKTRLFFYKICPDNNKPLLHEEFKTLEEQAQYIEQNGSWEQ